MTESRRYEALDLIRGICAVGIAVYHYLAWTHDWAIGSMGTFGVYIFFILSALTMMIRYGADFADSVSVQKLRAFAISRAARILPLLVLVAFVRGGIEIVNAGEAFPALLRAVLTGSAAMALHIPGLLSNTVGAWTLGIEAAFYENGGAKLVHGSGWIVLLRAA